VPHLVEKTDLGTTVEVAGRLVIKSTSSDQPSVVKLRHSFDLSGVSFPNKVLHILEPLFRRVVAECKMEERSWDDWAKQICGAAKCDLYRSWMASIAWFDYGSESANNDLTDLIVPLPPNWEGDDEKLVRIMKRIGYPTPEDRVRQLPVPKKYINDCLNRLGQVKVRVNFSDE
jgi:hypothetical protein